jgi:glucose 1-dehydrogenase
MKRIAVVTGSSRGIGKAAVEEFLEAGYRVYGLHRSEVPSPPGATFLTVDVSAEAEVSAAFETIASETDSIDVVVNNAALQINARLVETTVQQWDRVMAVNLRSLYLVTKAAYPLLKQSKEASVVNVSSVHSVGTSRGIAAYAASKGAIVAVTRAMALEMAEDGIRVNCVSPGAVDTDMLRDGFKRGHLTEDHVDAQMAELAAKTPLRKIGAPSEIARTILFLASPQSASFITGQNFIVDGGALSKLSTE